MSSHFELIAYTHGKERGVVIGNTYSSFDRARDAAVPFMQAMRGTHMRDRVDRLAVREVSTFETEIDIPGEAAPAESLLEG